MVLGITRCVVFACLYVQSNLSRDESTPLQH